MAGVFIMSDVTDFYGHWQRLQFARHRPFFPIWADFKPLLAKISPGALRLYIYLGISVDYRSGQCFYSVERMARDLECSSRTILTHLRELQDHQLIVRTPSKLHNRPTLTTLLPYRLPDGSPNGHSAKPNLGGVLGQHIGQHNGGRMTE
jgi:biotin operon repressor